MPPMPTPFMHLKVAQELLRDSQVPPQVRELLNAQRSAFLLGSIAADARINSGIKRDETHFYRYDEDLQAHAWQAMLERHPALHRPLDESQQVFVAAYVAHLAMDELWMLDMLRPVFWQSDWEDHKRRFFILNLLLSGMDERDLVQLDDWQAATLLAAQPCDWLPFMPDDVLREWRDFVGRQLIAGSETLEVLSPRVGSTPEEFRALLESPERMRAEVWANVPQDKLAAVEADMYVFAREQMLVYLAETANND